ncbi:MAG: hypothetical protein LBS09_01850 [Bacteroidales bacterium]|jgi:hypothetical protein|nr:hypothetical protein [Bacteroidales bacterium]
MNKKIFCKDKKIFDLYDCLTQTDLTGSPQPVGDYFSVPRGYSYLSAIIGSSAAAFLAGYHPKKTPIVAHTANETATAVMRGVTFAIGRAACAWRQYPSSLCSSYSLADHQHHRRDADDDSQHRQYDAFFVQQQSVPHNFH